jgi:hypothetical protein
MVAPPKTTVPEQEVLVAVRVDDVKPKDDKQAEEAPLLPAAVTVKPAGKVTVRAPELVPESPKERVKLVETETLERLKMRLPERVEPETEKTSVPSVEATLSYARTVVVCEPGDRRPALMLQVAGLWVGL